MTGNSPDDRDHRKELYQDYVGGHQGDVESAGNIADLEANILPRFPSDKAIRILDCGCGQGVLLGVLERAGYLNAVGIDVSSEQVALAHQTGRRTVMVDDLFDHAASHPGEYDVVVALDVAEHFERRDVVRLFRAWFSLLRPGGRLILRTPNGSSPFSGRFLYSDLTHGVIYTAASIRQASHLAGFERVNAYPARPAGEGIKRRARAALWRLVELAMISPLVIETGQLRGHIVTQILIAVCQKG